MDNMGEYTGMEKVGMVVGWGWVGFWVEHNNNFYICQLLYLVSNKLHHNFTWHIIFISIYNVVNMFTTIDIYIPYSD